jgi:peroxiredoxin family protein
MVRPPLYILLCSEAAEKLHMAAMMAALAAVTARPVEVFVSMGALAAFAKAAPVEGRGQGGAYARLMLEKGAADPLDLLRQGRELGELKVWACSQALDFQGWELGDLAADLFDGVCGLASFLGDAEAGQLVTL